MLLAALHRIIGLPNWVKRKYRKRYKANDEFFFHKSVSKATGLF